MSGTSLRAYLVRGDSGTRVSDQIMNGNHRWSMHVWFRRLLVGILIAGVINSGYGVSAISDRRNGEPIVNWLQVGVVVPPGGVRWTWGIFGGAESRPEMWHFDVTFSANQSLIARLIWGESDTVLYSRAGHRFEDSFELPLPYTTGRWRMDWQVANPGPTSASISNFTVHHYSVAFPRRADGFANLALGLIVIASSAVVLVWARRQKGVVIRTPGQARPRRQSLNPAR